MLSVSGVPTPSSALPATQNRTSPCVLAGACHWKSHVTGPSKPVRVPAERCSTYVRDANGPPASPGFVWRSAAVTTNVPVPSPSLTRNAVSSKPHLRPASATVESLERRTVSEYVCPGMYVAGKPRISTAPPGRFTFGSGLPCSSSRAWQPEQSLSAGSPPVAGAPVREAGGPLDSRTVANVTPEINARKNEASARVRSMGGLGG